MIGLPEIKHALAVRNDTSYLDGIIDLLVTKWEARAGIKDFRMRPWLPKARVREAHLLLESDIKLTVMELKRGA